MCLFPVGHNTTATLTGVTGRSLWTLTNSAGGALALPGGSLGGGAGGSGGGGGGDASMTYSDRSVSSWGEEHNRSRPIRAEKSWTWRSDSYMDTHTHKMKAPLAHVTGEEFRCGVCQPQICSICPLAPDQVALIKTWRRKAAEPQQASYL